MIGETRGFQDTPAVEGGSDLNAKEGIRAEIERLNKELEAVRDRRQELARQRDAMEQGVRPLMERGIRERLWAAAASAEPETDPSYEQAQRMMHRLEQISQAMQDAYGEETELIRGIVRQLNSLSEQERA